MLPGNYGSRPPPLCQSLQRAVQTLLKADTSRRSDLQLIAHEVQRLTNLVAVADREGPASIHENLKAILRVAGSLTGSDVSLELYLKTAKVRATEASKKAIKAFDKVGNYWHLCRRLCQIAASRHFRSSMASIKFEFLDHYGKHRVNGFNRHVHAEVQLAIFHRRRKTHPSPRAIGTSKAACYLCDLFLSHHPQYIFSATHGMLYEYWTIPDLAAYTSGDRQELQNIIELMYRKLTNWALSRRRLGAMFPVQSGIFQPPCLPSLTATATSLSISTVQGSPPAIRGRHGAVKVLTSPQRLKDIDNPLHVHCLNANLLNEMPIPAASQSSPATSTPEVTPEAWISPGEERKLLKPLLGTHSPQIETNVDPAKAESHSGPMAAIISPQGRPLSSVVGASGMLVKSEQILKLEPVPQVRRKSHGKHQHNRQGANKSQRTQLRKQGLRTSKVPVGVQNGVTRRPDMNKRRKKSTRENRNHKPSSRAIHTRRHRKQSTKHRFFRILGDIMSAFCGLHRKRVGGL